MTLPEDNLDDADNLNSYDVYAQAYRLRDDLKAAGQIEWSARIGDAVRYNYTWSEILGELRDQVRLLRANEVARQLQLERRLDTLLRAIDRFFAPYYGAP